MDGKAEKLLDIVRDNGVVKAFYANIKVYFKEGIVGRLFATGICPITLDSMTTGFNISTSITLDVRFNEMVGLTHDEVLNLMKDIPEEKCEGIFHIMKIY